MLVHLQRRHGWRENETETQRGGESERETDRYREKRERTKGIKEGKGINRK